MKFSEIDWATWKPRETATLMFVRMDGMVLLIRKLMGMGAGLINAPGGRVDPGETPEQGAIREAQEELHVTPIGGREAGVLAFQFADGYSLRCHVFTADACEGTLTETDEAAPFWCAESEIPYGRMWSDDRLWIPLMLLGRPFEAQFIFDDDLMLWHLLQAAPV